MTPRDQTEWERLNAYVDGEASPEEREAMREKARRDPLVMLQIEGLRRLKRDIRSTGQRSSRPLPVRAALAVLTVLVAATVGAAIGIYGSGQGQFGGVSPDDPSDPLAGALLATVPAESRSEGTRAEIPDLGPAGFRLMTVLAGMGRKGWTAFIYQGPHGCRVGLATLIRGAAPRSALGGGTRTWNVNDRAFVLLAPNMDRERFERLADAVEILSRSGESPATRVALSEVATGRPCLS